MLTCSSGACTAMGTSRTTSDFHFIALAYGFADADVETLVAERDW